MTRRVSFEVLTMEGIGLLVWIGIRAWHVFSTARRFENYSALVLYSVTVIFVWFNFRRVQHNIGQLGEHSDGSIVTRLSRDAMAIANTCYLLIFLLLTSHSAPL